MTLHEVQTAQETAKIWVIAPTDDIQTRLAAALDELPYDVAYASASAATKWSEDECNIVLLAADVSEEQREQFFARRRATAPKGHPRTTRTTPVLVVAEREPNTGNNGRDVEQAVEQLLQLGADDFVWLPLTSTMLRARIENMLALCRLRRREEDYFKDDTTLKLEHDLQVARRIQAGFLPRTLPQAPGWEVSARFQPAREVAGDFYDAFMMSQNRRIGFVIADVVDKGIPAALFMALVRSLTRAFAQQNYSVNWSDLLGGDSPSSGPRAQRTPRGQRRTIPSTGTISLYNAVLLTNNYIIDNHIEDNMFATLFFGMVDPSTGQLAYINAGHNPPYILDAQGNVKAKLTNTGAAVGMFPNMDYKIEQAQMEPGDLLFAYTDGVTEARNVAGEFVTDQGLLDLLAQPLDEGPDAATKLLDRIDLYLQNFMQDAVPFDDITMIAIHHQKAEG